mgnify:CR=1 FL=1
MLRNFREEQKHVILCLARINYKPSSISCSVLVAKVKNHACVLLPDLTLQNSSMVKYVEAFHFIRNISLTYIIINYSTDLFVVMLCCWYQVSYSF